MKSIIATILFATSLTASAEDFSLYYDLTSGVKNTLVSAVTGLQKIVFTTDNKLVVYKTNGTTETIDIAGASRIHFSSPSTVDIKSLYSSSLTTPEIYDLTGRQIMGKTPEQLERGIYIINGIKTQVK